MTEREELVAAIRQELAETETQLAALLARDGPVGLKLRCVPSRPFVKLTYTPFTSRAAFVSVRTRRPSLLHETLRRMWSYSVRCWA